MSGRAVPRAGTLGLQTDTPPEDGLAVSWSFHPERASPGVACGDTEFQLVVGQSRLLEREEAIQRNELRSSPQKQSENRCGEIYGRRIFG